MKKTVLLFLAILLIGTALPTVDAQAAPVPIASREDLLRISDDPSGAYVLTADIDMGTEPWTPIPFSGTLDGAGHTIANLTVRGTGAETAITYDGNFKEYETVFAGLFSAVRGAEIKNLHLINADVRVETDRDCFLGAVAGYAAQTAVTDCTVTMRGRLTQSAVNVGVGGMIGFSENCEIENCSVDAELVFIDVNRDVLCEEFLGGVFACGYGTVRACTVRTRGYADIYGYAHNGGVIGMFKVPRPKPEGRWSVRNTQVDAEIHFFEITPSRRAYCKALVGEDNYKLCRLVNNKELNFVKAESREPVPQRPEACETPAYTAVVTEPTCTEWGYTTYTCAQCGYTYRDAYTLPHHTFSVTITPATCTEAGIAVTTCTACGETYTETIAPTGHVPGDWIVTREAAIGVRGEEQRRCTVCGEVLETRTIPALEPISVTEIRLDRTALELHPGDTDLLTATALPADATDRAVYFESSDSAVATVDKTGTVRAIGAGTATITATDAYGQIEAICTVTVTETARQKLLRFFSFDWLRCAPDR